MLQRKKKTTSEDKQEYIEPIIPLNFNNEKKNMAQSIIINLPEPEKKKKKKKQKKKQNLNKSEELNKIMKSLYQQTLTKYIQGNYPPLTNIPDIRNVTNNDLLNMVNEMKIKLKEPVVAPSILTETTTVDAGIPAMAQPRPVLTETTTESSIPTMAEVPISQTQLSPPRPVLTKTAINKGSAEQISPDEQKSFILFSYFNNYIQNHFDINPNNDEIELLEAYNFYFMNKDLFDNLNNNDKNLYLNKYIDNTYSNLSDTEKNELFLMYSDCFTVVKSTELFVKNKKLNFTSSAVGNKQINLNDIEEQKKLKEEKVVLADEVDFLLNLVEELNKDKETLTQTQQDILNESEELKNNIKNLNDEEIKKYIKINKDLQNKLDETIKKLNTKDKEDLKDKISKIEISKRLSKAFNPEETKPKPVLTQAQGSAPATIGGGGGGSSPLIFNSSAMGSGSSVPTINVPSGVDPRSMRITSADREATNLSRDEYNIEDHYWEEFKPIIPTQLEDFILKYYTATITKKKSKYEHDFNYNFNPINQKVPSKELFTSYAKEFFIQNYNQKLTQKEMSTEFINNFVNKYPYFFDEQIMKQEEQPEAQSRPEAEERSRDIPIRPMSAQEAGLGIPEGGASPYPLYIACAPTRRSSDDTSTDPTNLDDEPITDAELSSSTISDSRKVCKRITREDVILLNKLEADNDLNKLQILYKKYYNKNFKYALNRTDEGKVIDIVYSFKNNGKIRPDETIPSTIPDPNLLPKYYQYLNELSTNNELLNLTDEYIIATGDDIPNNDSNEIKIKKIKDSNYIPTVAKNRNFFTWLNNNPNPITTPATPATPIEPQFNKPSTKLTISDNEVKLCFEVNKAVYLEPSRRERIAQLDYDDTLSNAEVAIYRDLYTQIIYFCSRGSQTAEDWLKTDLAIVFGSDTPNYSSRLNNEITILNQVLSVYRPTTIIYTGHSMGAYVSNELFIYTLKEVPSITQPFSIGFNGGQGLPAYYRFNPFDANFINTHVLQFHVKGDVLSLTQTYTPFGTLVNVPVSSFLIIPNHFLSAFDNFNLEPYKNFVDNGLNIPNPDQVVEEDNSATTTKSTVIEQTFINLLGQLYELDESGTYNRYDRKTLRYINVATYYDENKEYLDNIDLFQIIENNTTTDNQYNFYTQIYLDLKNGTYPREVFTPTTTEEVTGPNTGDIIEIPRDKPTSMTQEEFKKYQSEYKPPFGSLVGGGVGLALGAGTSLGNPIISLGTASAGAAIGQAIQNYAETGSIEGQSKNKNPVDIVIAPKQPIRERP